MIHLKMKRYITNLMLPLAAAGLMFTSCLEEFEPTEYASANQVSQASKKGLCDAVAAYMTSYSTSQYWNIGYASNLVWRDAATSDAPLYDATYNYFSTMGNCSQLSGYYGNPYYIWVRYYALIQKCNLVLGTSDVDNPGEDAPYVANSLAYRAMAYFDMMQWWEFRHTGFATIDDDAEEMGIMGLTVPIVTENTTEDQARNNPRAPFYKMYRFIINDLNDAERCMKDQAEPSTITNAGMGVIKGLLARVWLTLGTRFDKHPDDLATMLDHESDDAISSAPIGVTSARECYEKAATYAREAQLYAGNPVNESQWFDPKTGFNTPNQAWMWAIVITSDNSLATSCTWQSWVSFQCPEATYGISAAPAYNSYHMLDAALYDRLSDGDWRRTTWIDPDDVADEAAFNEKYARGTVLNYDRWSAYNAYCGFKFHPAGGEYTTSTAGNAVSIPLMRVEEMIFIEAEATGRAQGVAQGREILNRFMNSYRMSPGKTYASTGSGIEGFIEDLFLQKRIEFWGEGISLWDYRRLEHAVTRGYQGTNWVTNYRFNSNPDAVAPWSTLSVPELERNYNSACKLNPDPSYQGNYSLWTE